MRPTDRKLVGIAHRLAVVIGPGSCVVVGAMAVAVHGYARATTDVDLISRLPLPEARKRLADQGVKALLKHSLKGTLDGIHFDILPPLVPIDWENAVGVPLGRGAVLKIVDLPTLIHLKLRAGGPQDVLDVVMLLQRHPGEKVRARSLATAYGLVTQLESFMDSPRIKAKAPSSRRRRKPRPRKTSSPI